MKKTIYTQSALFASVAATGLFMACSSPTVTPDPRDTLDVVSTVDDLGSCTEANVGIKKYVDDENAVFICAYSGWKNLSDKSTTISVRDTVVITDTLSFCKDQGYKEGKNACVDAGVIPLCDDSNDGAMDKNSNGDEYVCHGGEWTPAREIDKTIDKTCSKKSDGDIVMVGYSNWVCRADSIGWVYDFDHINYDSLEYGNKMYKTVGIGDQMWMAENLAYNDTAALPNLKGGVRCHGSEETNCNGYGMLYQWAAAMNLPSEYNNDSTSAADLLKKKHQGVCPDGWHVPNLNDWDELKRFVDDNNGEEGIGVSLKDSVTFQSTKDSLERGTDRFGFSASAAGSASASGSFSNETVYNILHVADELECAKNRSDGNACAGPWIPIRADLRYTETEIRYLQSNNYTRKNYISVRCMKD